MLSFFSIWPAFILIGLALLVVSAPWFAVADSPPSQRENRLAALDGLRGYAAFGVFAVHSALYHFYLLSGTWEAPSRVLYSIAAAAVSLFFMITGYLFWGKLLAEPGRVDWMSLYIRRFFRIGPLYLFAIMGMLATVFISTSFQLRESLSSVTKEIWTWSQLGIRHEQPDVNGYPFTRLILNGVTWTLYFEWRFYFALLLLGFVARLKVLHIVAPATILIIGLAAARFFPPAPIGKAYAIYVSLFGFGMIAASLEMRCLSLSKFGRLNDVLLVALSGGYFIFGGFGYTPVSTIILGMVFFLIVSGANPFGILTWRPSRRLGDMSFSIYLLQGLAMTALFAVPAARRIALASPAGHWAMIAVCTIILLVLSRLTYVYIERPGMDLGRRIARGMGRRFKLATAAT
jgi:peptidoglycan/LPS O-acetylase OafA/YrhL